MVTSGNNVNTQKQSGGMQSIYILQYMLNVVTTVVSKVQDKCERQIFPSHICKCIM